MAERVEPESGEDLALGGRLWAAGTTRVGEDTVLGLEWGGPLGGASLALNGTLSQGFIKGTLSAPQPCRPLLCLAALPPSSTTEAALAPHTAALSPDPVSVPTTSCPELSPPSPCSYIGTFIFFQATSDSPAVKLTRLQRRISESPGAERGGSGIPEPLGTATGRTQVGLWLQAPCHLPFQALPLLAISRRARLIQ